MNDLVNIVGTDNYNRDHVADFLWKGEVPRELAETIVRVLNAYYEFGDTFFRTYELDARLSRGMEDLV